MSSQIVFLGTAGDALVAARQLRSSGGIILQVEDLQLHIDPGPGALNKAREFNVNLRSNSVVLASHNHLNHCNDLNAVINTMTLSGLDKRGLLVASKSVVKGDEENEPIVTKFHQKLLEKIIVLEKDQKAAVDLVEIHALSAEHNDPSAVGFKFFCPRFVLSYLGDTKYNKKLIEELQGSDILILNVSYPGNESLKESLDSYSAAKIVEKVKPRLAIITHFGLEMIKADPLQEARNIQRQTGIQTISAKDGLVICPESYSAKSPQARLSGFVKD